MSDVTSDAGAWFKGLGSAQQGGGGNYFTGGSYLCELVALSRQVSSDPKKRNARQIIGELKIVQVLVQLPAERNPDGSEKHAASKQVGEVCSVYINLDSAYPSMDMGKLKGIIEAAAGAPDDKSEAGWMKLAAVATEPPGTMLAGARIIVQGTRITTKAGKHITSTTFSAAPASS